MSFQAQVINNRSPDPVYLLHSNEVDGLSRWFYIQVPRLKVSHFLDALKHLPCDLANLGTMLASGFGQSPPTHIVWELQEKGFIE